MPKGKGRKNTEADMLKDNLKDSHEVQKSKPLFSLWKSDLTLAEFKILDTYLSRINSHNPEQRDVIFEKGELEKLRSLRGRTISGDSLRCGLAGRRLTPIRPFFIRTRATTWGLISFGAATGGKAYRCETEICRPYCSLNCFIRARNKRPCADVSCRWLTNIS